jgi:hypothetical protein
MTGVVYSVSSWLTIATPSGLRSSDPIPEPNASGTPLSSAARVVIRIGRKRNSAAPQQGVINYDRRGGLGRPSQSSVGCNFEPFAAHPDTVLGALNLGGGSEQRAVQLAQRAHPVLGAYRGDGCGVAGRQDATPT